MILYLAETKYQWLLFKNYSTIIGLVSLTLVKVELVQAHIDIVNSRGLLQWNIEDNIVERLKL